jgi:peroxiredoxin
METVLVVSSVLLWIILLFNVLLTLVIVRKLNTILTPSKAQQKNGLAQGQAAPDFTAETLGGATVSLATYTGRPVTFLFVSTTCAPCRDALPLYEGLRPDASRSGIELVIVSTSAAGETQRMVEEANIKLPVLVAPRETNSFMSDYNLSGTPSYCMVNAQGKVHAAGYPYPSLDAAEWRSLAQSTTAPGVNVEIAQVAQGR